jgi:hypothetical protein
MIAETVSATAGLQSELVNDFARLEELSGDWERLPRGSMSRLQDGWIAVFDMFAGRALRRGDRGYSTLS